MNFRNTTLLFGLLLGILWIFGLMLALGRSTVDEGKVFPKFDKGLTGSIDSVEIDKEGKKYLFLKTSDGWRLKMPPSDQQARAQDSEVDRLIDELRDARHSNEATDINHNVNDPRWGLTSPKMTITLKNSKAEREWKFFVGNEREGGSFVYVDSSERPNDVLAVRRLSLPKVFFDSIDSFRVKKLLDSKDFAVRRIELKETQAGKSTELILEKTKDKPWWFKKPPLGQADFTSTTPDKSVQSLLSSVITLTAEDFEPFGSAVEVNEKTALLRIQAGFGSVGRQNQDQNRSAADRRQGARQGSILRPAGRRHQCGSRQLQTTGSGLRAHQGSARLRSRDVTLITPESVDAVEIFEGKEFAKLFKGPLTWQVFPSDAPAKKANTTAITGPDGLLAAIQGKGEIKEKDFIENDDPKKFKEIEDKFAPGKADAKVTVWGPDSHAPEPEKKAEVKKDETPDAKKDDKDKKAEERKAPDKKADAKDAKAEDKKADKDQKADDKKSDVKDAKTDDKKADDKKADAKATDKQAAEQKKEEKKEEILPPKFKEGVKPVVTLSFVKVDKDKVLVKRDMPDAEPIYFHLAMTAYEKIVPRNMAVAFFDTAVPTFKFMNTTKLELERATPGKDHDKNKEVLVVAREFKEKEKEKDKAEDKDKQKAKDADKAEDKDKDAAKKKADEADGKWKLLQPKEFVGKGEVETDKIEKLLSELSRLNAVRWVQKVSKETLSHYGLDDMNWTIRVAVTTKKQEGDKEDPSRSFCAWAKAPTRKATRARSLPSWRGPITSSSWTATWTSPSKKRNSAIVPCSRSTPPRSRSCVC